MAVLSAAQRRKMPSSEFAGPDRSFPVNDKAHARAALMLINKAPASARANIRRRARAMLSKEAPMPASRSKKYNDHDADDY